MKTAVVAIAKFEEDYLEEWVQWHSDLGFHDIYIQDNSDKPSDFQMNRVKVVHFPGRAAQMPAYNNFLERFGHLYDWVLFIDIDEFLVLRKHRNVEKFLEEYGSRGGGLGLNWIVFGSSGHILQSSEPVRHRFVWRSAKPSTHIKSFVKPAHVERINNPHFAKYKSGYKCQSSSGNPIDQAWNHSLDEDIAVIHHYFTKSAQEFVQKRNRGRSDNGSIRDLSEFRMQDTLYNDTIDVSAIKDDAEKISQAAIQRGKPIWDFSEYKTRQGDLARMNLEQLTKHQDNRGILENRNPFRFQSI